MAAPSSEALAFLSASGSVAFVGAGRFCGVRDARSTRAASSNSRSRRLVLEISAMASTASSGIKTPSVMGGLYRPAVTSAATLW